MIDEVELRKVMNEFVDQTPSSSRRVGWLRMIFEQELGEAINNSSELVRYNFTKEECLEAWKLALAVYLKGLEHLQPSGIRRDSNE